MLIKECISDSNKLSKALRNSNLKNYTFGCKQVLYSIENPIAYVESNLVGFTNILEACRYENIKHLIYATHQVYMD